jgi:hypothetical protein
MILCRVSLAEKLPPGLHPYFPSAPCLPHLPSPTPAFSHTCLLLYLPSPILTIFYTCLPHYICRLLKPFSPLAFHTCPAFCPPAFSHYCLLPLLPSPIPAFPTLTFSTAICLPPYPHIHFVTFNMAGNITKDDLMIPIDTANNLLQDLFCWRKHYETNSRYLAAR